MVWNVTLRNYYIFEMIVPNMPLYNYSIDKRISEIFRTKIVNYHVLYGK